jgi:hypothetical protein
MQLGAAIAAGHFVVAAAGASAQAGQAPQEEQTDKHSPHHNFSLLVG